MLGTRAAEELRRAVRDCRERGLTVSARWAVQQLLGLPPEARQTTGEQQDGLTEPRDISGAAGDEDAFQLARSLFDLREYRSAAHVLRSASGSKSAFLRCYATYLAGEKQKEEASREDAAGAAAAAAPSAAGQRAAQGPTRGSPANQELRSLEMELRSAWQAGAADGFQLYLLGLVLADLLQTEEAAQALVAAVTAYPCNWGAWQALQSVCGSMAGAAQLALPDHFSRRFFSAALCLDLQLNAEALQHLQELAMDFPSSETVVQMAAQAHYNLQNFDEAQELFEELLARDPHRMEGMDTYSNILYVKEEAAALSHLAHRCVAADRYRPEACCVVGNYYSLKGQHEKAVQYFRRALRLNPGYLSAWTLMGHEYVELKNPPAAIEAYRHAVDVSPRDYRAWYGLGQTYELVNMPYYALHYFRRAVQLRPSDARMWNAMGHCYQQDQLGMYDAAIRCHRRALPHDREGVAVHELAKLHSRLGQREEAAHYHRLNLDRIEGEGLSGQDAVEALSYLAEYHKGRGELELAEGYYMRLLDYGAATKEQAKSSLRELRALQEGHGMTHDMMPSLTPVRPDTPPSPSAGSDMGMSPL